MRKILVLAVALALSALSAFAAPASCTTWSLSGTVTDGQLLNTLGSGFEPCSYDGYVFNNFSVYINSGFTSPTAFSITLTWDPNGDLHFGDSLSAGEDIELEFSITPGVPGMYLVNGEAGTGVNETVCSAQITLGGGAGSVCGTGFDGNGGTILGSGEVNGVGSTLIPIAPSAEDWVFKDVNGTSGFDQVITPEPMTLSLMGVGLLGLGVLGRRMRK